MHIKNRVSLSLIAATATLLSITIPACPQIMRQPPLPDTPDFGAELIRRYSVRVDWRVVHNRGNTTLVCRGDGSGLLLGGGWVLTAAHVVDQNPMMSGCADLDVADPVVEIGVTRLPAKVVAIAPWDLEEDVLGYPRGDLALLRVDARMTPLEVRVREPFRLCRSDLTEAQSDVLLGTEYGVFDAKSQPSARLDYARIDFRARRGDSGGAVFDAARQCLLGVISSGGENGTDYVPNSVLRRFLRASVRGAGGPPLRDELADSISALNRGTGDSEQATSVVLIERARSGRPISPPPAQGRCRSRPRPTIECPLASLSMAIVGWDRVGGRYDLPRPGAK